MEVYLRPTHLSWGSENDDELNGNALGWANTLAGPHRHPRTRWLIIIFPLKSPFWVPHFQIQLYSMDWFKGTFTGKPHI